MLGVQTSIGCVASGQRHQVDLWCLQVNLGDPTSTSEYSSLRREFKWHNLKKLKPNKTIENVTKCVFLWALWQIIGYVNMPVKSKLKAQTVLKIYNLHRQLYNYEVARQVQKPLSFFVLFSVVWIFHKVLHQLHIKNDWNTECNSK